MPLLFVDKSRVWVVFDVISLDEVLQMVQRGSRTILELQNAHLKDINLQREFQQPGYQRSRLPFRAQIRVLNPFVFEKVKYKFLGSWCQKRRTGSWTDVHIGTSVNSLTGKETFFNNNISASTNRNSHETHDFSAVTRILHFQSQFLRGSVSALDLPKRAGEKKDDDQQRETYRPLC